MAKNLRHEIRQDIFNAFKEGMNKHEIKQTERERVGVWSYGTRADLLDKANVFCEFLKEEHVRTRDQITREHVTKFLEQKAHEGCTQRTVDAYRSAIGRIGELSGRDWHADSVTAVRSHARDRGADDVMSRADFDKICEYARDNPSRSGVCVLLEREIGVRVGDLAYGYREVGDHLEINSKNGRICIREITPLLREVMQSDKYRSMLDEKGHLHAPLDNSINKYLRETEARLCLEHHSFHAMRRCVAQEKYDELRNSGLRRDEALGKVGEWLNHGEHREQMVLESYIANAW